MNGKFLLNLTYGLSEVDPSFKPGDTLYINTTYIDAQYLQTNVAPCEGTIGSLGLPSEISYASLACQGNNPHYNVYWNGNGYAYNLFKGETTPKSFWNLAFVKPGNVGKTFSLTTLDKRTNGVISKSTVTINSSPGNREIRTIFLKIRKSALQKRLVNAGIGKIANLLFFISSLAGAPKFHQTFKNFMREQN